MHHAAGTWVTCRRIAAVTPTVIGVGPDVSAFLKKSPTFGCVGLRGWAGNITPFEPGATPLDARRCRPQGRSRFIGRVRSCLVLPSRIEGRTVLVDGKGALAGSAAPPPLTSPARGARQAFARWVRSSSLSPKLFNCRQSQLEVDAR